MRRWLLVRRDIGAPDAEEAPDRWAVERWERRQSSAAAHGDGRRLGVLGVK